MVFFSPPKFPGRLCSEAGLRHGNAGFLLSQGNATFVFTDREGVAIIELNTVSPANGFWRVVDKGAIGAVVTEIIMAVLVMNSGMLVGNYSVGVWKNEVVIRGAANAAVFMAYSNGKLFMCSILIACNVQDKSH